MLVCNLKNKEKITKIQTKWYAMKYEFKLKTRQSLFFFKNDLKYLWFTIEVYGKNWYIKVYHA